MSDNMISTASSVDLSLVASQAEVASYVKASSSKPVKAEGKELGSATETKAKTETSLEAKVSNPMADFSLEFQVDDSTNDVTVFILDRTSHEVVRTIPPEELNNLNPGDLLQLFA